jgi:hypothetical protein
MWTTVIDLLLMYQLVILLMDRLQLGIVQNRLELVFAVAGDIEGVQGPVIVWLHSQVTRLQVSVVQI